MSDPRVTVELLARADLSVKATLDEAWGKQWQEVLNDTGLGKCTLANDDPDLGLVDYGDFLRFSLDGVHRFISIVEKKDRVDIDPAEEYAEATTLSGRGALAVLEEAVVYPDLYVDTVPFSDTRVINFSSLWALADPPNGWAEQSTGIYDWGAWATAGPYASIPAGFPDATAHWLGPEAPDGGGSNPVGDWYVSTFFAFGNGAPYRVFMCADDSIEFYVDNALIHKADAVFGRLIEIDLFLDSAFHYFAFKVTNLPLPDFGGPSGLIWAIYELNEDGTLGSLIWHSHPTTGGASDLYLPYPTDPPGVYPGQAISFLIQEAQNRGCFPLLAYDFTDFADSDGAAWTDIIQPSWQIGMDVCTATKQLGEDYYVARMDPTTLTLHLYKTMGAASGATYTRGDNIVDLTHEGTF